MLVWLCHQLLSRIPAIGHLPSVLYHVMSVRANDKGDLVNWLLISEDCRSKDRESYNDKIY